MKYRTAADLIKKRIVSGNLKAGAKLPSVKSLSKELNYSKETIIKAYQQLESEHLVYSVPKSGFYVVKSCELPENKHQPMDLATVSPPDSIHPYRDFTHCMEKAVSLYGKKLFSYASPKGMPELINVLAKHLVRFQLFVKADNLFITNGAQQALYILANMEFPHRGTRVLVEQPTYSVMLDILKASKTPTIGIRRSAEGLDLDELEGILKQGDIKFFYTIPRFQNPTGFCYDQKQKNEILQLVKKYGIYMIEDDYLADLEPDSKVDPLYAMGEQERIIYIQSFSKTLMPGLRLGMAILPEALHHSFLMSKRNIDLNTPILTQGALEIYLKSSMYKFHIKRIKAFYQEKMSLLKELCGKTIAKARWHIPDSGIYAYLETEGISSETLVSRLKRRGLYINSTNNAYIEGFPRMEGLRLCVCNTDDQQLMKAVHTIYEEIEKLSIRS